MNINFPPVDEKYLKDVVRSGYYSNVTEAVRDAVRRMREGQGEREWQQDQLELLLQEGLDSIGRGGMTDYTPELVEQMFDEAMQEEKEGRPVPDYLMPKKRNS